MPSEQSAQRITHSERMEAPPIEVEGYGPIYELVQEWAESPARVPDYFPEGVLADIVVTVDYPGGGGARFELSSPTPDGEHSSSFGVTSDYHMGLLQSELTKRYLAFVHSLVEHHSEYELPPWVAKPNPTEGEMQDYERRTENYRQRVELDDD